MPDCYRFVTVRPYTQSPAASFQFHALNRRFRCDTFKQMKRTRWIWLMLLAANAAADVPGVTPQEVVIGACTTLSGPNGFFGIAMTQAAQAYFTMINDQGGVHARQIAFQPADDKYEVGESTTCFKDQLDGTAFAAGFPIGTETSAKYAELSAASGLPFVGFFPGAAALTVPARRTIFTLRPTYFEEADAMVDHLAKDYAARRVGVIFQKDADGEEIMNAVRQSFQKHGATLRAAAGGAEIRGKEDIDNAISVLRAGNPDAVILALSHDLAADLAIKAKAVGWRPLFLGFSTMGSELFLREAGAASEGVVISQVVPPPVTDSKLPAVQLYRKLVTQYQPRFNPSYPGFEGFLSAIVIVAALRDAGEQPTQQRFVAALEAMKRRDIGLGPDMPLQLNKIDHAGLRSVFFTTVKKGRLQPLDDWRELVAAKNAR